MGNKKARILVVGSINMDLVMNLERSPDAGETVLGYEYSYIPGGKGANQAVAAARINGDVTFCGHVGDDSNGNILLNDLNDNGVDISYIKKDQGFQTGLAVIPVEANGQNRIMVFPGANHSITKEDVDQALERDYDAVMLQLEIPIEIVFYTIERAHAKEIPVVLDAGPSMKLDLSRLKGVYIISPNETEAQALTGVLVDGEKTALEASKILAKETGAQYVIIKMGDKGAFLYEGGNYKMFPAYKVRAVDTTAAGDSFTAAVAVKMAEHGHVEKAIEYANAVGAICVSRKGAQPSLPTSQEVAKFMLEKGISN